jgi:hypothetical protein
MIKWYMKIVGIYRRILDVEFLAMQVCQYVFDGRTPRLRKHNERILPLAAHDHYIISRLSTA